MRIRRVFVLTAFIITWSFLAYYFILRTDSTNTNNQNYPPHNINNNKNIPFTKESLEKEFNKLDNEIVKEYRRSNDLTKNLLNLLHRRYDEVQINDKQNINHNNNNNNNHNINKHNNNNDDESNLKELEEFNDNGSDNRNDNDIANGNGNGNLKGLVEPPAQQQEESHNINNLLVDNADSLKDYDNTLQLEDTLLNSKKDKQNLNLNLPSQTHLATGEPVIPILVFSCNRVTIRKCLDNLIQYRTNKEQFPIIVSQDCRDEATKNTILSYNDEVHLIEQPDQSDIFVPPKEKKFKGYYKIARHYGWALNTTFANGYDLLVIVEDDLNVAPDFFEYFLGTYKLLQQDPSLWCISAWNDNGKENFVDLSHPELLYRTDFFPGLGWMLTRQLWNELSVKWPKSFWDDWIRHPAQRKDRVCIRPEISRTKTFGKIGVSNGLFFDKYLKYIKLSTDFVPFTSMNLTYLLKNNYDNTFLKKIYTYPVVTYDELRRNLITVEGPVRIQYSTRDQYKRITKMLGLMDDLKSGVPRTAYHGIVSFFYSKRRVHLAPNANWKGYDLTWS